MKKLLDVSGGIKRDMERLDDEEAYDEVKKIVINGLTYAEMLDIKNYLEIINRWISDNYGYLVIDEEGSWTVGITRGFEEMVVNKLGIGDEGSDIWKPLCQDDYFDHYRNQVTVDDLVKLKSLCNSDKYIIYFRASDAGIIDFWARGNNFSCIGSISGVIDSIKHQFGPGGKGN